MTTRPVTRRTQDDVIGRNYASVDVGYGQGLSFENAVLDTMDATTGLTSASAYQASLTLELPSEHAIREWISMCPSQFTRDMAYGLLTIAVHAYDSGDLDSLGQAVVDWASTLELEADRKVVRRMRRRMRSNNNVQSTNLHRST